jgi:uncharacterized protein (TIGR03084 family)
MVDISELLADLTAESSDVDSMVADLPAERWSLATPAAGWTIAHQIAHLTSTDTAAITAITDPDAFAIQVTHAATNVDTFVDDAMRQFMAAPPDLLERWRLGRERLAGAIAAMPPGARAPWYATPMSAASMATARLMETWAHGLDIAEALGLARPATARLRHVAYLGYRTLGFSFLAHGRSAPTTPVRVVLDAPDGTQWTFGPEDAPDRVSGPALDFCLLVTQRRHRDDLSLVTAGPVATQWLEVAQAFAGPAGTGRDPRS